MPNTSIYKSPFNCFIKLQGRKTPLQCHRDYIVKHSKNIIDLIEVGDYVNGMLVVSVTEIILDDKSIKEKIVFVNRDENCTLKPLQISNEDIKTIVTKEQFASMEYRLEG